MSAQKLPQEEGSGAFDYSTPAAASDHTGETHTPVPPHRVDLSANVLQALRVAHGSALDLPEMRGPRVLLNLGKVSMSEFLCAWQEAMQTRVWPELYKAANRVCQQFTRIPRGTQEFEDFLLEVTNGAFALLHEIHYDPTKWPLSEYYYQCLAQRSFDSLRGIETVRLTRTQPDLANPDGPPIKTRVRVRKFQPLPDNFDRPAPFPSKDSPLTDLEFRDFLATFTLRPTERALLESIYQQGLTLVEYAKVLGEKPGTVSHRHARLLVRLRHTLASFLDSQE